MRITESFEKLPREDKYAFNELFLNATQADWYVTDLYTSKFLMKLAHSMSEHKCEIMGGDDWGGHWYMIVRKMEK
jgi:hypothetical protein